MNHLYFDAYRWFFLFIPHQFIDLIWKLRLVLLLGYLRILLMGIGGCNPCCCNSPVDSGARRALKFRKLIRMYCMLYSNVCTILLNSCCNKEITKTNSQYLYVYEIYIYWSQSSFKFWAVLIAQYDLCLRCTWEKFNWTFHKLWCNNDVLFLFLTELKNIKNWRAMFCNRVIEAFFK